MQAYDVRKNCKVVCLYSRLLHLFFKFIFNIPFKTIVKQLGSGSDGKLFAVRAGLKLFAPEITCRNRVKYVICMLKDEYIYMCFKFKTYINERTIG